MPKSKSTATIISHDKITTDIYDLWLATGIAKDASPGRFVGIYPKDGASLLPRPLSICDVGDDGRRLRVVYRVAGRGTAEFATYAAGGTVDLLGILGNGFPVAEAAGKRVWLVGGGIGIPPLLYLAKTLCAAGPSSPAGLDIFLGYRDSQLFLADELAAHGHVHVATDDGSAGIHGHVMDAVQALRRFGGEPPGLLMACGPQPMLRAMKSYAGGHGIPAFLSLEERMACGIGACLACVCKTAEVNPHTHVRNARVCLEGPVFAADELE